MGIRLPLLLEDNWYDFKTYFYFYAVIQGFHTTLPPELFPRVSTAKAADAAADTTVQNLDQRALAYLFFCVRDADAQLIVANANTAAGALFALKDAYEPRLARRAVVLEEAMTTVRLGPSEPMEAYMDRVTELFSRYRAATGEFDERRRVKALLRGLPEAYEATCAVVYSKPPEACSFHGVAASLQEREHSLKAAERERLNGLPAQAAAVIGAHGSGGGNQGSKRRCHYCKKPGHTELECRKAERDRAARGGGDGGREGAPAGAARRGAELASEWVVSAEAEHHLVWDRRALTGVRRLPEPRAVLVAGCPFTIHEMGNARIDTAEGSVLELCDVGCCPTLPYNVLSALAMTRRGARSSMPVAPDDGRPWLFQMPPRARGSGGRVVASAARCPATDLFLLRRAAGAR